MDLSLDSQPPLNPQQTDLVTQQLLRVKLKHDAHNKRRQGWTYYTHAHGLFVLKAVFAAYKAQTKRVVLNTMRVDRKPETVYQRLMQGLKWLQDATDADFIGVADETDMSQEDYATACEAARFCTLTKNGVQIVLAYTPPENRRASTDDEILAMFTEEATIQDASETPNAISEFRSQLMAFLESGPEDEQATWNNVADEDGKWALMLTQQDTTIHAEYNKNKNIFVCLKYSKNTLEALR